MTLTEHVAICHSEKENYRLYVFTLAIWSKVEERGRVGLKKASDFSYSFCK